MTPDAAPVAGPEVVVRPMRRRDVRDVRRIDAEAYPDAWSHETWLAEIDGRADRHHLVATRDGRVVGHGGLMLVVGDAHVTTVAVAADQRRCGVARRLVTELLTGARERGATAATLEVRASNHAAQALYRSFGFAPVGIRRDYYPDGAGGREDAIVMWLTDLDGQQVGVAAGSGDTRDETEEQR